MKPLKPETLLVANLPTTTGGVTIEAKVVWFAKCYTMDIRINYPSGGSSHENHVRLEEADRYSFKRIQDHAAGCLLRDDVRREIHRLCAEHGLTLLNPVF